MKELELLEQTKFLGVIPYHHLGLYAMFVTIALSAFCLLLIHLSKKDVDKVHPFAFRIANSLLFMILGAFVLSLVFQTREKLPGEISDYYNVEIQKLDKSGLVYTSIVSEKEEVGLGKSLLLEVIDYSDDEVIFKEKNKLVTISKEDLGEKLYEEIVEKLDKN